MEVRRLILLLLLLLLATNCCSAARHKGKKGHGSSKPRSNSNTKGSSTKELDGNSTNKATELDDIFPEHLRSGFEACKQQEEGARGMCKLLAALTSQMNLVSDQTSSKSSTSSSCKFRDEGGESLHKYATDASADLQELLRRYSQMHQRCTTAELHLLKTDRHKRQQQQGTDLQCRYVQWSCNFGLGNKFLSLVSTFLYAILSQRVLLIENDDWDKLVCDAFPTSQWHAPSGFSLESDRSPPLEDYLSCYSHQDLESNMTDEQRWRTCSQSGIVPIVLSHFSKEAEHRFLVNTAALAAVRNIPVLNFRNGNQYFAVGFFLNPVLRPILEKLFPERRVFNNLARFLLKPSDEVWARIKQVQQRHFSPAIRTIGVQVREAKGQYRDHYDVTVPRCIRRNAGMCPIEIDEFQESMKNPNSTRSMKNPKMDPDYISVYVSSLMAGHARNLTSSLRIMEEETGQRFEVTSLRSDGEQKSDYEHLQGALVDIWALSLSDVLLTSHMSTFGYTAQGLAGLTPLLLKSWPKDPCWWGISSDPCFHYPPNSSSVEIPPYVKRCPDYPHKGMQLVEAWGS